MQRRSFLASILAAAAAPAFVRQGVLMPVKQPIWVPTPIGMDFASGESVATIGRYLRLYTAGGILLADIPMDADPAGASMGSLHMKGAGSVFATGVAARFEMDSGIMPGHVVKGSAGGPGSDLRLSSEFLNLGQSLDIDLKLSAS